MVAKEADCWVPGGERTRGLAFQARVGVDKMFPIVLSSRASGHFPDHSVQVLPSPGSAPAMAPLVTLP